LVLSKYILLLIALVGWCVPTPLRASTEKSTQLVFYTNESLIKGTSHVYRPYLSELPKPQPNTQTKSKTQRKIVRTEKVQPRSSTTGWNYTTSRFARGQCTDYVARKAKVTWFGNANRWITNAKAQGYVVDKNPVVGSILVTAESRWGHVTYIESVQGTTVTISEWNYRGKYVTTYRTFDISDPIIKGIIHS